MAFVVASGVGSLSRNFTQTRARFFRSTCPTMAISKGDKVPSDIDLMTLEGGAPTPVNASSVFANKKIALVTVPGALTSTCQNAHIPQWVAKVDEFKAKGADAVVCLAVNDPFVVDVFEKAVSGTGKITFLADGNAAFTKTMGFDMDTGSFGGIRAIRGSFLVEDGVFTQINLEAGGEYEGPSKPETLLDQM